MVETTSIFLSNHLSRYQIEERIGSGGMARVYKGRDINLDRTVAIKILHEHLSDDETFMARFKREAKLVAALNHPNIIQVYDFDTIQYNDAHIAYMVMSYIPGITLQKELRDLNAAGQIMPQERGLKVLLDLCSALGYAHERGMVHRDVKPANILFDQGGNAILTDFGIARMAENSNLTQEGLTVGTPAYMSPEQATGGAVDHRSDLYALGIIAYEIIAGQPPFEDDGSLSILLKHLNEPVPPLSSFPHVDNPYLDAVITKALAKRTEDRYQSAQEFAADLQEAYSGRMPYLASTYPPTLIATSQSVPGIPATITAESSSTSRLPLLILAMGISVIAILLFFGFLNQQSNSVQQGTQLSAGSENEESSSAVSAMVSMPIYFSSAFDVSEEYTRYWPQNRSTRLTREILPEGVYRIENRLESQAVSTIFEPGDDYGDLSITMTGRLEAESDAASGYGIIFRYADEDNYNVFAVDGVGRYSIWVRENGRWYELRHWNNVGGEWVEIDPNTADWTDLSTINRRGENNELTIEVNGDMLTGFINGEEVVSVSDNTLSGGKVGIYLASTSGANTTILIEDYQVRELVDAMTGVDSMTCEGVGRCLDDEETTSTSMTDETEVTPETLP